LICFEAGVEMGRDGWYHVKMFVEGEVREK
jgi:hypothetical protein